MKTNLREVSGMIKTIEGASRRFIYSYLAFVLHLPPYGIILPDGNSNHNQREPFLWRF